jgi:hypothetical protein
MKRHGVYFKSGYLHDWRISNGKHPRVKPPKPDKEWLPALFWAGKPPEIGKFNFKPEVVYLLEYDGQPFVSFVDSLAAFQVFETLKKFGKLKSHLYCLRIHSGTRL